MIHALRNRHMIVPLLHAPKAALSLRPALHALAQEASREREARERGDRALEREKAAREKEASARRERDLQLRHLVKLSRSLESARDK